MNYAFGLTRIRLPRYVIASFVCMAPGALAYTYLGYAGRDAASGQAGAIRKALLASGAACGRRFPAAAGAQGEGATLSATRRLLSAGWKTAKK